MPLYHIRPQLYDDICRAWVDTGEFGHFLEKLFPLLEEELEHAHRPKHHDDEKTLLLRILERLNKIERQQKMIAQQIIDDTGKALQDAANNIINHLPGNTTPSTPDASVQGLISVVQSVTSQLNAAAGPATPTVVPTPPPQPAA